MTSVSITYPTISIILPVRNESKYIRDVLSTIQSQQYPRDKIEVIVVDGGSQDGTEKIIDEISNLDSRVHRINNPEMIAAVGMNLGINAAQGALVARVDGHCKLPPNYLSEAVRLMRVANADIIGGPVFSVGATNRGKLIALAMSTSFGVGDVKFRKRMRKEWEIVDTVPFPVCRKDLYVQCGLYNTTFVKNQDDEFSFRVRKRGKRVVLARTMGTEYYVRNSFIELWNQYYRYGYWKVFVIREHPRQAALRHWIPSLFILIIITSMFCMYLGIEPVFFAGLFAGGLYILMNVGIAIYFACRWKKPLFLALPACFVTMHICYGVGFWCAGVKICIDLVKATRKRCGKYL